MTRWKIDQLYIEPALIEQGLLSLEEKILDPSKIPEILELSQYLSAHLRQLESYVYCLLSQNTDDKEAPLLQDLVTSFKSRFASFNLVIDELLLLAPPPLPSFPLEERILLAKKRRPLAEEKLAEKLSINGLHGWGQLYDSLVTHTSFPFQGKNLSFGQIENKLDEGDRCLRKEAFFSIQHAFDEKKELFARVLNHLGGFRLENDLDRGYTFLEEALERNRMEEKTLFAMWKVVEANKQPLFDYLAQKAKHLGIERLSWYDLEAPLKSEKGTISLKEGSSLILQHFHHFSPDMAHFAERALANQWVESEDRPKKRPGGFCTNFPLTKETRIFMTYGGSYTNLFTLAHELGHAYHSHVVFDLPEMEQDYRMNVAETASTMAEMILISAAIEGAKTREEKLKLLDEKIQRSVTYLLNIHARFLFEKSFYEERMKGYVSPDKLSALMLQAQKTAFGDKLETYHPFFWASKMHFFFSGSAFYNFPYTFGYLLSLGIYDTIKSPDAYRDLLKDTGRMTVEDLVEKHLGFDLRDPLFWEKAVHIALADISLYLKLSCS
ncbi:MAG: M3 family oligoendopeptidase [Simkaniaceae bacterium]|nr:M3 family oligoendopeptidase [Simkaniaceae bacterium]